MDLQTPQLNTPSNPEQKNNWFASHMIVGYVFLFAILAAAVSGIYYWQTVRQIPSSVQFPVHKDVTASWKTYTNTQYGFEFKYPSDWSTRDESTADTNPQTKFNNVRILKETGDNNYLYIEFTSGLTESSGVVNTYPRGPDISAGGIDWKTNIGSTGVGAESSSIFLNTKYGNRFYYIELYPTDSGEINPVFNQILSTFKFSDSIIPTTGTLQGTVHIGPFCPVEQVGNPCPVPPNAYLSTHIEVYSAGKNSYQEISIDSSGNYSVKLLPDNYTVDYKRDGDLYKHSPQSVTIVAGQTIALDFSIDTGIR